MRRVGLVLAVTLGALFIATPAQAFAHNRVHNVYLHAVLDVLTLAAVTAPIWTAYFWGRERRGLLLALVTVVQLPVAIIGFVQIPSPTLHAALLVTGLALTATSMWTVRRMGRTRRATAVARPTR